MTKIQLFSRFSIFVIFFWFGILKVLDLSPATPLVTELSTQTLPFISPSQVIFFFGVLEMLIGVLFLMPSKKVTRFNKWLFAAHMIATFLPFFILPQTVWQASFVPTFEGQYIIKNLALIVAVAIL